MKSRQAVLAVLILCLSLPVLAQYYRRAKEPKASMIEIQLWPKKQGFAYKKVSQDGVVTGGHLTTSADGKEELTKEEKLMNFQELPRIQQLTQVLRRTRKSDLFQGKEELEERKAAPLMRAENWHYYMIISYDDDKHLIFKSKDSHTFEDINVQTLNNLVRAYRIGGW